MKSGDKVTVKFSDGYPKEYVLDIDEDGTMWVSIIGLGWKRIDASQIMNTATYPS